MSIDNFILLNKHMETVLEDLCILTSNGKQKMVEVSDPNYVKEEIELLGEYGYISLKDISQFGRWSYLVTMEYPGLHYGDFKKEYKRKIQNESIRYWITTTISILALIISGISLYVSMYKGG